MKTKIVIMWFRQDLRIDDNPALLEASKHVNVLPIFILDQKSCGAHTIQGASAWWLHEGLKSLKQSLDNSLNFYVGQPKDVLKTIGEQFDIEAVFWNRCYEPWRIHRDTELKKELKEQNIKATSSNASLLYEPWEGLKKDDTPYKVYTPFYRNLMKLESRRAPVEKASGNYLIDNTAIDLVHLNLLDAFPWHQKLANRWTVDEQTAHQKLHLFLEERLDKYAEGRDFPDLQSTSELSAYLRSGQISPHQIWFQLQQLAPTLDTENLERFQKELIWREFSYSLLYHFPDLPHASFKDQFKNFPWEDRPKFLEKWQKGQTGIPIIDAGMRELWQTGIMHNRVRMLVASFLVKNALIDWRDGFAWFWNCLIDADLASNSASWQWVAGTGADAAPYFRIFNPVTQSVKFDPDGNYIRKYVPELVKLPTKYLFAPWEAPIGELIFAGVRLGETYPKPILDLKETRKQALQTYAEVREMSKL